MENMVNRFKYDLRYLHVFVILFKQSDNRMTAVSAGAVDPHVTAVARRCGTC